MNDYGGVMSIGHDADRAPPPATVSELLKQAEQVEVGATVHLAFDHLDAIDVSFDYA